MSTHTIAPPAPFNFKNPEEWPKWILRFDIAYRPKSTRRINTIKQCSEEIEVNGVTIKLDTGADMTVACSRLSVVGGERKMRAKEKTRGRLRRAKAGEPVRIGSLSKLRRQRQRERHQTKGLMGRTIALHVRLKSWYIS